MNVRESDRRAFEVWGERARERQNVNRSIVAWTDSPLVLRGYVHPAISGRPDENWLGWAIRRYFPEPVGLAVSIGSGDGGLERHGLAAGLARRFEGFDASAGAVELARRLAAEHGIADRATYAVADLNEHVFEPGRYDAALASMAVHHIQNLEHFFVQVQRAVKPGALFVMSEFVGPTQFQWTDRQMRLADELLQDIPREYRRSLQSGHVKKRATRQTVAQMNAIDPTEAVRSAEIIPIMWKYFEVIEQVDFGGTLLNLVLEEIAGNFTDNPHDLAILDRLFAAERRLLRSSAIPSDFSVLVGRVRAEM